MAARTPPRTAAVKSADRTLDVLELVAGSVEPLPHAAIGAALGIPKSSLTGLLRNLEARGYLARSRDGRGFEPGRAFLALLARGRDRINFTALALPVLERLSAATGESSSLSLFRGDEVERVCGVDSPQALAYRMTPGARFPLYSTSAGKIALAWLPPGEREAALRRLRLKRITARTLGSVAELRAELAEVERSGIAYLRGENTRGIVAVAAGVRSPDGAPLGALNVVAPEARYDAALDRLSVRALRAAVRDLEARLAA